MGRSRGPTSCCPPSDWQGRGITVNAPLASSLNSALHKSQEFSELQQVFAPPVGKEWRNGEQLLADPQLSDILLAVGETTTAGAPPIDSACAW